MRSLKLIAGLAAALAIGGLVVFQAHAQQRAGGPGFGRGQILQRIVKGLELTPDQIAKIKEQLRSEKDAVAPLLQNLHQAKKELRETINKPEASETEIRAAAAKVAVVEADLAVVRARISAKIRPILTEEQIQKVQDFQAKADDFVINAIKSIGAHLDK